MNRLGWWFANKLAQWLEPHERDAVCGDQAELGATGAEAARDVFGLVTRRQLELWKSWRPWLSLVAVVVPLGALLHVISVREANGSAVPIWMYLNNWTMVVLESPGSRGLLINYGITILRDYLALACWSWAAGLMLGAYSRRAIPVNGVLFGLLVLFASLLPSPLALGDGPNANAAVFSLKFYRVMFPSILQSALVLLPAVLGMRQGLQLEALSSRRRSLLLAFVLVTVAVFVARNWGWVLCEWGSLQSCRTWVVQAGYGREVGVPLVPRALELPLTLVGPIGYLLASTIWRKTQEVSARGAEAT